jgi:plasmid stabilization system protein ParE
MSQPTARILIPVISGVSLFALGFWAGNRQTSAPEGASANSGAAEAGSHFQPYPAASDRPASFADEGGGAAGGGAPGPLPAEVSAMDLARILENPDRRGREQDLESLGARDLANGTDWKAAAASIGDLVDRGAYLKGVIGAWAAENPRAAVAYLATLNLSSRVSLVPHAVSIWAEQDPATAEGWVIGLSNGEVKDQAVESLYRSWAVRDPGTAAARSLALADESSRFRALAAVVKEWSANDLAAVGRWASELKDPNLKDFATMAVADEMSLRAPKEAMRWASDHLAKDPQANPAIISLVASKAGFESPQETFDWLKSVRPSPEAASSLAGVATYLAEEDPEFAWKGFAALPAEIREITAAPVASTLGSQDPESGKRWLAQLPEGQSKHWATSAFVGGWASRQPEAAEVWVKSLPEGPQKAAASQGLTHHNGDSGAGGRSPSPP